MRVIVDTNVFISGVFWAGPPSKIMDLWENRKLQIVLSTEIFEEYKRVAYELKKKFPLVDVILILDLLLFHSELCASVKLPQSVCKDPDDDKFLACALEAGVDIIISGDKDLLDVSGYQGIEVLSPAKFIKRVGNIKNS